MKVLIIDDHDLFCEGLKLLLEGVGHEVQVCFVNNCEQAIKHKMNIDLDLVLLDYNLQNPNGFNTLETVKQHFPTAIAVIVSSEDSLEVIQSAIAHGAAGYIPKSSSKKVLVSALDLVLSGGTYLPPQAFDKVSAKAPDKNLGSKLTRRQRDAVRLAIRGIPNKIIASQLGIAEGTVKAHLYSAYKIMGVRNRTEAVMVAAKYGTI